MPANLERLWPLSAALATLSSAALLATALAPAAETAASAGAESPIESQAEQLGDPSYAIRERATRQLIDAGIAARPIVRRLLANSDPEVRARAVKVLGVITEFDFRARLDAFAADIDGKRNYELPGWERFKSEMGDSRESRAVFVAMQRAEPELWEAFASRYSALNTLYSERCEETLSTAQQPLESEGSDLMVGAVATLLFLGGVSETPIDEDSAVLLETLVHYQPFEQGVRNQQTAEAAQPRRAPGFTPGMRTAVTRALYRRLLGMWIARDDAAGVAKGKLIMALNHDLKDAGMTLARQVLGGDGGSPDARPYAILVLGRFGSRDDVRLIERYFSDEMVCVKHKVKQREVQVQVREVALAAAAHLTNQDLKSYGFERAQPNAQLLFVAGSLGLKDDAARSNAFQKWADWKASQGAAKTAADGEKQAGGGKRAP